MLAPARPPARRAPVHRGTTSARILTRARILLKAGDGWRDGQLMEAFDVSRETVSRVRTRFASGGLEAVLHDRRQVHRRQVHRRQVHRRRALTDEQATQSDCPRLYGSARRPRPLDLAALSGQGGRVRICRAPLARNHSRRTQKNALKPWQHQQWCIPALSAEYVYRMEDVLDLYAAPADPTALVVCLDEKPATLHAPLRDGQPPAPGYVERRDYEYARCGAANLFVLVAPHQGWRHVAVTEHRASADYAEHLRFVAEEIYPEAARIRLVQGNVSMHTLAALYGAFPPERARTLARRFEGHYTPKYGSWLNMAEIEISVFSRGCLLRLVPTTAALAVRVAALEAERNAAQATIQWHFSVLDAHTKLHKLFPEPLTKLD